jgi:hypothetical protein
VLFRRAYGAFLVGLWVSSLTPFARADEARERAAARAAADSGADAFEQNDYGRALELFSRAEQLYHAPPHLLFMARSLEKLGRLVEARETYLKLVSEKLAAGAPKAFQAAQAAAETELNLIEKRLPSVTISVRGDEGESVQASLNGTPLPPAMIGIPVPMDPGTHVFSAKTESARSPEVKVELREGARETVELTLSEKLEPTAAPRPPANEGGASGSASASASSTALGSSGSSQRSWGYVTLGAGVVFAGVSTGFMVSSLNKRSESDRLYACNDTDAGCTDDQVDEIDAIDAKAEQRQYIAIGGYVLGGAAIVGGLVLVLTADSDEREPGALRDLRLIAGPGWLGAAGRF